ncbi:hypothetical protein [Mucilaginibacter sp.]|uniref:hypothetical protein n=1 Tax=Mucilaginibacter sp. TaxID=1882438 RepID=UPI00283B9314|nr:hypothetical protein [Mucilaginibacter sp.]MDR3693529.1 hypothetical protein [Mucilaginibacter sp.]
MEALKQRVFSNWNFSRFLRLGMGLWMLVWSIQSADWAVGLFSGLFIYMALSNTGCCGAGGCAVNYPREKDKTSGEV